jgi:hypothetical protein
LKEELLNYFESYLKKRVLSEDFDGRDDIRYQEGRNIMLILFSPKNDTTCDDDPSPFAAAATPDDDSGEENRMQSDISDISRLLAQSERSRVDQNRVC